MAAFFVAAIALLIIGVALLIVILLYRYGGTIWSFFDWLTRPRIKAPDFSGVRCQSVRVIIHERKEEGFLRRYFWCKDCDYEWFNIDPRPPQT